MKEANAALRRRGRRISSSRQPGLQRKTQAARPEDGRRRKRLKSVVYVEIVSSVLQTKDAQSHDSQRREN